MKWVLVLVCWVGPKVNGLDLVLIGWVESKYVRPNLRSWT